MTIEKIAMGCKPDPYKFTLLEIEHGKKHTIVLAKYDGCASFNGKKLMLLKGIHTEFTTLDPHFLDEDYDVVARFIPTYKGLEMARKCVEWLELTNE